MFLQGKIRLWTTFSAFGVLWSSAILMGITVSAPLQSVLNACHWHAAPHTHVIRKIVILDDPPEGSRVNFDTASLFLL